MNTDRNSEREWGSPPPSQWVLSTQSVWGVSVTEWTLKKGGVFKSQEKKKKKKNAFVAKNKSLRCGSEVNMRSEFGEEVRRRKSGAARLQMTREKQREGQSHREWIRAPKSTFGAPTLPLKTQTKSHADTGRQRSKGKGVTLVWSSVCFV